VNIFCPQCEYQPRAFDRWVCAPGCGTWWNTFETRARCPGCRRQWRETCCPTCARWSPHEDWYHDEQLDHTVAGIEAEAELVGVP
jgi:hypothetical protein